MLPERMTMKKISWKNIKELGMEKLILVLAAGILLLVIVWPSGGKDEKEEKQTPETSQSQQIPAGADSYEKQMEQRLKDILSCVEGVGEVDVMITLKSSKETLVQTDSSKNGSVTEETDNAGGSRRITQNEESLTTVLVDNGSGGSSPYVRKEMNPEIAGIIISAQGGGSSVVKNEIYEAVLALFDVPSHKIKVLKKQ